MKQICRVTIATVLFALSFVFGIDAQASVVVAGTRVVYNQTDSEVTVKLSNNGKLPGLVQIWLDKGDPSAKPDTIDLPFTITPPVTRINPNKSQTLRIIYTGEPLPSDKELCFYLNVLEIPPKPTGDEASANQLQLAFRTRIKFFFRPEGLKGQAVEAPAQIVWRLKQENGKTEIVAHNPTQYHVSVERLSVSNGAQHAETTFGGMVDPGGSKAFQLNGDVQPAGAKLHYFAINDYGGLQDGDAALAP